MNALDESIGTRPSLLKRLRNLGDQASWREFFDTYWRLIFNVALQTGLNECEAEDVVQETMLSISRLMPDFKYNPAIGSFRGFLLQVTRRRIVDQFRKRRREICATDLAGSKNAESAGLNPPSLQVESELERIWDAEWQKHLLEKATERVKRRVDPKHYQLFHMVAVEGLPAKEVAKTMEVSEHLVYKAKERISEAIRKEVEYLADKMI